MKTRIFMTMLALFAIATTAQAAITCSKPTELTATEITANSVKLSWTENGEATAWEIQYSTDADNIDEGTTILVTENPYTLTGLTAQTTYYARVRAVCGEGDYSNWSQTATFTTAEPVKYKITIERTPNDYDFPFIFPSLTPSAEGNYYAPGTQVRVDIPDPNEMNTSFGSGAYFAFLFVDGVKVDVIEEDHLLESKKYYTFTMPEADVIIVVEYTMKNMYHITKSCDPADGGTISGPSWSKSGRTVTLTATPNEGYVFKEWRVLGGRESFDDATNPVGSFRKLIGNTSVLAVFAKPYPLWIGDTQVDEANKDDIPGVTGENAKASFDPATNTLTLENVTGVTGNTMGALITAEGIDLTVEGSAVLEDKNIDMGIQV
ncbi:MAG: fibronectin type III domain-containing protein, partial [Prevotella sp.]|nr:fibronectin type III domain-containing protein [Prevotella sp.]